MSMIGNSRNDRIHPHHQAPPMKIPSSVEFDNNSSISYHPSHRPSQPIPIKACTPSPQEVHENAMSEESSSHYDMATWRMYSRISIARRRHMILACSGADSSLSSQDDSYHQKEQELDQPIMNRDDIHQEDRVKVDVEVQSPRRRTPQPSDHADAEEGIFEIHE